MIYYNFITIILFFVVFILILKFKDFKIENFQTTSSNIIEECKDIQNNSLDCNILRVMNDRRINKHILQLLKDSINEDSKKKIDEKSNEINDFLENTEKNKENVDKILLKLRKIDADTDEQMDTYIQEKIKSDKYLLELSDNLVQNYEKKPFILDNTAFKDKNAQLRNKLAEYYDRIKNINKKSNIKNENILILKNIDNKMELNLLDVDKNIKIFSEYKNIQSKIYNLIINDNCVNFKDKYNYNFENCQHENKQFLFTVNKIEDYIIYNKFIMYNKTSRDFHTVESDQVNIEYPFYLICPLNNFGVCVTYEDNKISFKPIRNEPKQRFKKILNSNFCSYE